MNFTKKRINGYLEDMDEIRGLIKKEMTIIRDRVHLAKTTKDKAKCDVYLETVDESITLINLYDARLATRKRWVLELLQGQ